MRFIHVSDLHFHRNQADNREANSMLSTVRERYPDHLLIVTGDISDDGNTQQFANAFKALEPFKGKIFIAPGNHDFGAAGNFHSRERALRFDQMLSEPLEQGGTFTGDNTPVVNVMAEDGDHVMLIALDTNLETDHPFDFACGEVGNEQLSVLNTILADPSNAHMVKILFFHHHPFMHNNPFMQLGDAQDLMRTIYGRVDILLFGHKHVSTQWVNINGIGFVLASDNSPGKDWAREISIENRQIGVNDISIKPNTVKKSRRKKK
jgi:3',5'-cyclic AMP phosphodiesterase CpdA